MVGRGNELRLTLVHLYEKGFGLGLVEAARPLTTRVVLTSCPSQVQHVLREGQQDLCHLQRGEEAVALYPAGHRVVCGRVSILWPSEVGWGICPGLLSAEKLHLAGAFTVQAPVQEEKGFRHLGKGRGPGKGWGSGRRGGWMLAGFTTDRPEFKFCHCRLLVQAATQCLGVPFWEESLGLKSPCQERLPCIPGFFWRAWCEVLTGEDKMS